MHDSLKLKTGANISAENDGRLSSASATRNCDPIMEALLSNAPMNGRALELASGTGEHAAAFAKRFPEMNLQPSEIDAAKLKSISAWRAYSKLPNFEKPIVLDATSKNWSKNIGTFDLIYLVNLLHLISDVDAHTLIEEAIKALENDGCLALYGPFLRSDGFASASDENFHESLKSQNPLVGYKSIERIELILHDVGFGEVVVTNMPANNLMVLAYPSKRVSRP